MQRRHVDVIDVRAFLAVDLDVDEELVHHRRDAVVLETLVRHHVTPVARSVADREQDGLVAAFRRREGVGAPWPPVDRVVLVLQQIGTGLARKAIFAGCNRAHVASTVRGPQAA